MSLLFALPLLAHAQDPEPSREYRAYEQAHIELDMWMASNPNQQLDWGTTTLVSPSRGTIGLTITQGSSPRVERWYFYDMALEPNEGFEFHFRCAGADTACMNAAKAEAAQLPTDPAYKIPIDYKEIPPQYVTDPMVYSGGEIDFFTFKLYDDDNNTVGHMLREVHYVQAQPKYIDHWILLEEYPWVTQDNDRIRVVLSGTQYAYGAAFFQAMSGKKGKYGKAAYAEITGAQASL
jgi:hypothetical protein